MLFADSLLQLLTEQRSIVKRLVDNSTLKQSELTLLNIEYEANQNLWVNHRANYNRDVLDLKVLAGIADTSQVLLPDIHLISGLYFNFDSGALVFKRKNIIS